MNDLELAEHRMLVSMFIDSHRPDRRYMSREEFAEYGVSVEPALFQGIVGGLKSQGIVKTRTDGFVRLHGDKHAEALSRILAALGSEGFAVDWQTKRVMFDESVADQDRLIPTPNHWMLLGAVRKQKPVLAGTNFVPAPKPSVASPAQSSEGGSMGWISKYVTVWQSRIALGILFFGAVVVGLWPEHNRAIDPVRLIACITTGFAWLAAELASAVTKVSSHDISLFERIRGVLNDDALTFLREHDFGYDTHERSTRPVVAISEWHGPSFIFNDRTIQRRWHTLFNSIIALSHLYGDNLITTDRENWLTVWHPGYERHNQPDKARQEVAELNEASHNLYREYSDFVLFARKRLDL